MSTPITGPLPEVPRREKCEVEDDRHLRPCTTLDETMIAENPAEARPRRALPAGADELERLDPVP